ncbi:MAG: chloride channel protein [Melioribacteraceae bacterium]|nr:chloride channel protein [Melioribacteraceae bacterium]MCF8264683.1 chloride channel protein [Melioribacteraceae bacterium]MCF8413460.1 chloride channel protein [Melioribacteraceae bacterium]
MKEVLLRKSYKTFRKWRLFVQKKISQVTMPEYTIFSIYAIVIGIIVGLAAVSFHTAIHLFNTYFFEKSTEGLYFLGAGAVIFLPAVGMFIQSMMIKFAPETAAKRGVGEVIKSVALRGGYIPFRTTLFHFIAPVICIGSGGTVGPEGPAAQLGGGVSSKFANLIGLSDSRRRVFTAAGSGAAISAIFNTPLGGIFFALEVVLMNDFHAPTFTALILASVTASAISRILLGDSSVFIFDSPGFTEYEQLYLFIILGLAAGILSVFFVRYSHYTSTLFKDNFLKKYPRWLVMTFIGLVVGVCGYFYSEVFGIGYIAINSILANQLTVSVVAVLLVMKFFLVPLMLNSGGFGGVFAPSLFIGACLGFIYAFALNHFFGFEVQSTTYILVAMGAVLGGINSIPLSSILIIFEMTKDYSYILPLMLAVIISTTLVQLLEKSSIHLKHLEDEGFKLSQGRDAGILRKILVKDVMRNDIVLIPENTSLPKLISQLIESPHGTFYIVNKEEVIVGRITENDLRPIITEYENLVDVIVARDIAKPDVNTVNEQYDLEQVLKLFGHEDIDQLPVVSVSEKNKILGTIWKQDIISAYNRESLKHNLADGLARELQTIEKGNKSRVAEGYSIIERTTKTSFVGKTLLQLRLRNRYGLEVLMIRKASSFLDESDSGKLVTPDPNYVIQRGDKLVLFGADEKVEETSNWQ